MEVCGQLHATGRFTTGTQWTGSSVGLRAGLDTAVESMPLPGMEPRHPTRSSVTILSYNGNEKSEEHKIAKWTVVSTLPTRLVTTDDSYSRRSGSNLGTGTGDYPGWRLS
jgi:hypothetical protein